MIIYDKMMICQIARMGIGVTVDAAVDVVIGGSWIR
jgi:hypothetical protein